MDEIRLKARGKINIGLDILGLREDGYHEMDMIMQTVSLYDDIFLKKNNTNETHITCSVDFLSGLSDNLAYKACELMRTEYGISEGVDIHIEKHIPISAGMAGGSTDAATVLFAMNKLFDLNVPVKELMRLGLKLGADVPYCVLRGTCRAKGVGEKLKILNPFPEAYVIIAKPPIAVSTKEIFTRYDSLSHIEKRPDTEGIIEGIRKKDLRMIAENMGNVLENVTIDMYPVIDRIKKVCDENRAIASMMTGSGPTVFALFTDVRSARRCFNAIRKEKTARELYLTEIFNVHRRSYD